MGRTLKNLLGLSFVLLLAILASTSTYFSVKQKTEIPSLQEITDFQNNSNILLINKQTKVLHKSRASAVQVFSANIHQHLAMQSGTYVIAFERYFVLTTNHGIIGDCLLTKIYVDDKFRNCIRFIELNQESDYAIIEVEKIPSRKPVKIPQDLPTGRKQWTKALGVMNRDGKYIGYVLAIDVGENNLGGAAILENVVLVIPAFKINWAAVLDVPQEVPEADDTAN